MPINRYLRLTSLVGTRPNRAWKNDFRFSFLPGNQLEPSQDPMHIRSLNEATDVNQYLSVLKEDESCQNLRLVKCSDLQLTPKGLLSLGAETFQTEKAAQTDLAKLARIPNSYFSSLDAPLRSINFNHRLPTFFRADETLKVTISNDKSIQRVRCPKFSSVLASTAIQTLLDEVPSDTISNGIRVVEYARDRRLEVALVSPSLAVEPRKGDLVCGGVHLTIEENGALQVGPETYRLVCQNGAMARVCAGGHHRLRRGQGKHSEQNFLSSLHEFARTAWQDWEHVSKGIQTLASQPLARADIEHAIRGLRQSPFFISVQAAKRVRDQLDQITDDLTFYELHNAITFVGSHDGDVLPQYRYRLRLGAGHLARGQVGVFRECRRLTIAGPYASR